MTRFREAKTPGSPNSKSLAYNCPSFHKRKRFTEEQIIRVLKQAEAGGKIVDLCRQVGITHQSFYSWKARHAGIKVSDAKRLQELEAENRKLKQLLGEAQLGKAALKELLAKNW